MSQDWLVTGFGPFGTFDENPSQALAERCSKPHEVLEVSFRGVDEFLRSLAESPPRRLLLMGVAGGATKLRVEWVARNAIGSHPDVRGEVYGPGPIDPRLPPNLAATLWTHEPYGQPSELWEPSVDAGTYLCNYAFFRSLASLTTTLVGFLHVPPP
ncbi:MAG: hypothetical protein WHU10_13085, partial [Fimbriimonadales bacterium]